MDKTLTSSIRMALQISLRDKVAAAKTSKTANRYATAHHHVYTGRYQMALDVLPETSPLRPALVLLLAE